MSQLLLQVVLVVVFAALCFGCGYLTAFIVTRNQWRDEMIKRHRPLQLAHRQMGMGRAAERTHDLPRQIKLTCADFPPPLRCQMFTKIGHAAFEGGSNPLHPN